LADNQTLVIGLGRFGRVLAETLVELGDEVLGVDSDQRVVQECADDLTHVVRADATDAEALRQIGAAGFERAVVAIGDVEASILTTYTLVDLGVATIWAKATTAEHGVILQRVGASRVVFPERDMGVRLAHTMIGRTVDYIELDDDFVLLERTAPHDLAGRSLREAEVRTRHDLTVVAIKRPGGRFGYTDADSRVEAGDLVVVAGSVAATEAFSKLG